MEAERFTFRPESERVVVELVTFVTVPALAMLLIGLELLSDQTWTPTDVEPEMPVKLLAKEKAVRAVSVEVVENLIAA